MKYKKTINNITVTAQGELPTYVNIGDRFGEGIQGLKMEEVRDLIYMLQEVVKIEANSLRSREIEKEEKK